MSKCVLTKECVFFKDKMADMPYTASVIKAKYCEGEGGATCARYLAFEQLGIDNVPQDLLPNQTEKMKELLEIIAPRRS